MTAEALRELVAVEGDAAWGDNGSKVGARLAADRLAQGAVLLRMVPVRAKARVRVAVAREALGESPGGRGRVRVRGVVNLGCFWMVSLCDFFILLFWGGVFARFFSPLDKRQRCVLGLCLLEIVNRELLCDGW